MSYTEDQWLGPPVMHEIARLSATEFRLCRPDGSLLAVVDLDTGAVALGAGVAVDDAARRFWDAITHIRLMTGDET